MIGRIEKIAFAPKQVSAHVGKHRMVNADIVAHTATARNGADLPGAQCVLRPGFETPG